MLLISHISFAQKDKGERWIDSKIIMRAVDLSYPMNLPFTKIYVRDSIKDIRELVASDSELSPFPAPSRTAKSVRPSLTSILDSTLHTQPNTIFYVERLGFDPEANRVTVIIDWWGITTPAGQLQWFPSDQLKKKFKGYYVDHPLKNGERLAISEFISNRFFRGKNIYEEKIKAKLPTPK